MGPSVLASHEQCTFAMIKPRSLQGQKSKDGLCKLESCYTPQTEFRHAVTSIFLARSLRIPIAPEWPRQLLISREKEKGSLPKSEPLQLSKAFEV